MKKILYIIGVLLAFASCTDEETAMQEQGVTEQTFNVAISEPDYAPQTRAEVKMSRYLLEMYEGEGDIYNAVPVRMENTDGKFNVTLKKGVDYICLFWADEGADAYTASNLQYVTQKDREKPGTVAYCARVTVNSNNFDGNITLKRAVAELSFIDTKGLTGTDNTLKIAYPYNTAAMDVNKGTVIYSMGPPLVHTLTGITPPSSSTDAFADGTVLAQANMTHTYSQAGEYPITISSTQRDGTQVQMPKIDFYANYSSVNDNPAKLVSLNTPLLNMGTDLSDCFISCSNLTAIPAGLFAKNTAATQFSYCFYNCTNLKPAADIFCNETTEKTTRFANKTIIFSYCFYSCGADTDGSGTFPVLWEYTMSKSSNTTNCFTRAKATNAGNVPTGWGTPATATD